MCVGRARRALGIATEWAATREQFGQQIGKFQGVSFKLADMRTQLEAAELLTLRAAWKDTQGTATDADMAMAKVFASEMCQFVTDEAIQILGGMGLMDELPLERMWRDTRVDRIWDGTSEIQRHIISRAMLRPFGGVSRSCPTLPSPACRPRSIAVVGGAPAERVVRQCLKLGFDGPIWPVHPTRAELAGVPCLPSLDDLPGVPDAVFLGVNRHATVEAMTHARRDRRRRRGLLRLGLRRDRRRPTCSTTCSTPPATCRSSVRTATASSTRSTGWRCGPTSTAAADSTAAWRSSRRAATSPSTSRSSSAGCGSAR